MEKNKRTYILIAGLIGAVLLFTGCLDMETIVHVKSDGSGTVEQTFLMQKDILQMIQSMNPEGEEDFSLLDREELRENAEGMGEGVEFVSADPYERDEFTGYKAIYSFTDVSNLRINQNPGANMPDTGMEEDEAVREMITFSFNKGNPSTLVISLPRTEESKTEPEEGTEDAGEMPDTSEMESMMKMYEKMKISMRVELDGKIRKTNATHRDGSTVTLMEMDFGKIFSDEKTFKKLARTNPDTLEDLKEIVDEVPGIKVEMNEKVEVAFD